MELFGSVVTDEETSAFELYQDEVSQAQEQDNVQINLIPDQSFGISENETVISSGGSFQEYTGEIIGDDGRFEEVSGSDGNERETERETGNVNRSEDQGTQGTIQEIDLSNIEALLASIKSSLDEQITEETNIELTTEETIEESTEETTDEYIYAIDIFQKSMEEKLETIDKEYVKMVNNVTISAQVTVALLSVILGILFIYVLLSRVR